MLIKKSALLSCGVQQHLCGAHHLQQINTSPSSLPPPRTRPGRSISLSQQRTYADVRDPPPDFRDNIHWPKVPTPSDIPTPYQIFQLERGAKYQKARFYELVKIYHPDRHGHSDTQAGGLPQTVKLERYRLIVLANELLSDPTRKKAYDKHGLGWGTSRTVTRHTRGYSGDGTRPYGTGPGQDSSPFRNATWEDWENWREARAHPPRGKTSRPQDQTYMNHNLFAGFVILFGVLSGIATATQSGQYSTTLEAKIQLNTAKNANLIDSRQDLSSGGRKEEGDHVKWFLQRRDPSAYGLKPEEEETYSRAFAPRVPPNLEVLERDND